MEFRLSRIPHEYSSSARRAMGICLATLLTLSGTAPVHADMVKRLPAAMMPGPGNVGASVALSGSHSGLPLVMTGEHPLFQSSYTGAVNQVLATTKYGDVTSRDLYLWMIMRGSEVPAYLPALLEKARFPNEREELSDQLRAEVDDFVFYNYIVPRIMPGAPQDPIYDLKHHVYTLPVWQTVFLLNVVQPSVTITQADRQKYLQDHRPELTEPERLRTRYIFMRSPETDSPEDQGRMEVAMDELRASILRGEISFSDAARQHSQAPSAKRGGEIPPFQHGELFFRFEHAAAGLEPGAISPVFRGPNGFYMVQLLEVLEPEEPSLANPEQARAVEEGLSRQVLKAAYDIYMRDMLLERRRIDEYLPGWDQMEDHEIIGEVCDLHLTKGQVRSAWPEIEGNDLKLNVPLLATIVRSVLEREAMAADVRDLGFANDPMLERARWMAGNLVRRDAWMDSLRASLPVSEELVRTFWRNHPDLFTPLALKRVIRLTMRPSNTAPLPAETRMELDQVLAQATGQPLTMPIQTRVAQDEEKHGLVPDVQARTAEAFEMLTNPSGEPNFYSEPYSPESLEEIIESVPENDVEPIEGNPAPGMDVLPAPEPVTTDTLDSLVTPTPPPAALESEDAPAAVESEADTASTTAVLDLATTATEPRGGQAPTPAAGGIGVGPSGIAPQPAAPVRPIDAAILNPTGTPPSATPTPASAAAAAEIVEEEESEGVPYQGPTRAAAPAGTPTGGPVPIGIAPSILPPGSTPNPSNQLKPPPTSAIPFNPEWFYARMEPTDIQRIVGQYASSDWLLVMEDLGFVYTPDLADAPAKLEKVPVGAFSRPIVRGRDAISWYIEDARKVEKPSFEEVKTHAFDVYRSVQLDKITAERYNSELKKAGIDYKF